MQLSSGRSYGADMVISAIGVDPNASWLPQELQKEASDGGVLVDRHGMRPVPTRQPVLTALATGNIKYNRLTCCTCQGKRMN